MAIYVTAHGKGGGGVSGDFKVIGLLMVLPWVYLSMNMEEGLCSVHRGFKIPVA